MAETRRLFFALWPDARLQSAISTAGLAIAHARALGGRDIPPGRVHLTLLFLGDVAAGREARLCEAAARVKRRQFDLVLDQAGCFYRSRAFWVGPGTPPAALMSLWEDLLGAARGLGVAADPKALAPHVTCVRDIEHRIRPVGIKPIVWPVRSFALVHSAPAAPPGAGPEYHLVSQWPLQTRSA